MRLAVIVPTYTFRPELGQMAAENARIWKTQADDVIITEDGGGFYKPLYDAVDLYMMHPNIGVAANINLAWKVALVRGADFVALADSDVTWAGGKLRDLCIPGKVGIPYNLSDPTKKLVAPMLVVPQEVAAERGLYNDYGGIKKRMEGFDPEYQAVIRDLLFQDISCKIYHRGSATRGFSQDPILG